LGVQTDSPAESLRALIERTAAERRRAITGRDGETDNDSDGCESDDDSWIDE
jgi:hypothetical protein